MIAICLIIAPWIYVAILLTADDATDTTIDTTTTSTTTTNMPTTTTTTDPLIENELSCKSVKLAECATETSCRTEAIKLVRNMSVLPSRLDL